jgi:pyrrolidone-carboxylate peptidase
MFVEKIKKEIKKATSELIQEGFIGDVLKEAGKYFVENILYHTEITVNAQTKEATIKWKKEL